MFKRIVKIVSISLAVACIGPINASPIGFYFKPTGEWYVGGTKNDQLLGGLGFAWQPNRMRMLEAHGILVAKVPKGSVNPTLNDSKEDVLYALNLIDKHLIPVKYYINFYTQWGFSLKNKQGIHAPFVGFGGAYYMSRRYHLDLSYRHYPAKLNEKSPEYRRHSLVLGGGVYIA